MDSNISEQRLDGGILVATIDMPGRSMNVFSAALMDSLEGLIDRVAADAAVRAVVIRSGKKVFLAGADLAMVRMFTERARFDTSAQLHALCGRLSRLFRRLEMNGKPFVAAVNGLALGGGLELALACHARVADDRAHLGLPEVKLGLLPGAGGTQRLPRLVGQAIGLDLMLRGDSVSAAQALELGILDAVVPVGQLLDAAVLRAQDLAGNAALAPWDRTDWAAPIRPGDVPGPEAFDAIAARLSLSPEDRAHYPAYHAIMSCVTGGWHRTMNEALDWEMDRFVELIRDPVAGHMIRGLFLDRQRAAKLLADGPVAPMRAAVIGDASGSVSALLGAARVEIESDAAVRIITAGAVDFTDGSVAWLRDAPSSPATAKVGVWVTDAGPNGRAIEICRLADGASLAAGLDVARWLRATPVVTTGTSLFQSLAVSTMASAALASEQRLLAVSLAAARVWENGGVQDTRLADSAAVIGGFHPAWTGGPFAYLAQLGRTAVIEGARTFGGAAGLFAVPVQLDALLKSVADSEVADGD